MADHPVHDDAAAPSPDRSRPGRRVVLGGTLGATGIALLGASASAAAPVQAEATPAAAPALAAAARKRIAYGGGRERSSPRVCSTGSR